MLCEAMCSRVTHIQRVGSFTDGVFTSSSPSPPLPGAAGQQKGSRSVNELKTIVWLPKHNMDSFIGCIDKKIQ